MPLYESLFIIRQSVPDEEASGIIDKITKTLETQGATLRKVDNWGKKKLAYEIQHDRRGTYVVLQFEAAGKVVNQLERAYRLEDSILKFLTVRVEEEDLKAEPSGEMESESAGVQ